MYQPFIHARNSTRWLEKLFHSPLFLPHGAYYKRENHVLLLLYFKYKLCHIVMFYKTLNINHFQERLFDGWAEQFHAMYNLQRHTHTTCIAIHKHVCYKKPLHKWPKCSHAVFNIRTFLSPPLLNVCIFAISPSSRHHPDVLEKGWEEKKIFVSLWYSKQSRFNWIFLRAHCHK